MMVTYETCGSPLQAELVRNWPRPGYSHIRSLDVERGNAPNAPLDGRRFNASQEFSLIKNGDQSAADLDKQPGR
jgi:hypothetical protein